ncbi:MAG: hypothetical protein ACKOFI_09195, partial [Phycisphaerales bacterium]
ELRAMAAEVRDLRTLRTKYEKLLTEHNGLLGALRDLSSELASGARAAWPGRRCCPFAGAGAERRGGRHDIEADVFAAVRLEHQGADLQGRRA